MSMLIIVVRESMLGGVEEFLHQIGVEAYSIMSNVMGKGLHGKVHGTFLKPDINVILATVLPDEQAAIAISALRSMHDERKAAAHDDHPVPIKVFSYACKEHV